MPPSDDVQAVLSRYKLVRGDIRLVDPLGNAGGWSGSRLWRVVDASRRELCLRQWPTEHPTAQTLRWIHSILLRVAPQLPLVACPLRTASGESFVAHTGHFWELTRWLPGQADFHANPNRARLRAAMQVLARFHQLTSAQAAREVACPPAVLDRRRQYEVWRHGGFAAIERSLPLRLNSEIDAVATRMLTLARKMIESSPVWHSLDTSIQLPLQPAIRDVHHDHLLFTGDEVTGLIDFGAMRIDTPLTDVARLVGSLACDVQQERDFAFDAYSERRPLSEADRNLIDVLDKSSLILGGLNWLKWLYVERRDMGPTELVLKRLAQIVWRLSRTRAV